MTLERRIRDRPAGERRAGPVDDQVLNVIAGAQMFLRDERETAGHCVLTGIVTGIPVAATSSY